MNEVAGVMPWMYFVHFAENIICYDFTRSLSQAILGVSNFGGSLFSLA